MASIFTKSTVPLIIMVLFVFYKSNCVFAESIKHKYVIIRNDVGGGVNLTLHCKSKDDDLGVQNISPGGEWGFHFKTSAWGTTLFFCSVEWPGTSHYFDAFVQSRDMDVCDTCVWSIKPDQPCIVFSNRSVCHPWNK
ncbi:S-protein homolog 19-like [Ziziphus jujuba]|uniref:S-protein homolog n=1 Tax=Ziziphus jujuba TaxID=326968 RepID=A0ABM3IPD8_ZIZJJ|nr:S-protein homolog 19-like [Ziziphus jujuba]